MNRREFLERAAKTIALAGVASGWIYNAFKPAHNTLTQTEANNLAISFMKQYGTENTIDEAIIPKIYEVAWTSKDGTKNISANIGGIWVILSTVAKGQ